MTFKSGNHNISNEMVKEEEYFCIINFYVLLDLRTFYLLFSGQASSPYCIESFRASNVAFLVKL